MQNSAEVDPRLWIVRQQRQWEAGDRLAQHKRIEVRPPSQLAPVDEDAVVTVSGMLPLPQRLRAQLGQYMVSLRRHQPANIAH